MFESTVLSQPDGHRPKRAARAAHPIFHWPPQPKTLFKWMFGFPGYLWPWQMFFIGLALALLYLTPEAERMRHFSLDWIGALFACNLLALIAFVSAWHYWLYVRRAQGTKYKYNSNWLAVGNPKFLFRSQLWDNVFWNVCSAVPIWTAYEAVTFWLRGNGFLPTIEWRAHPIYCVLLLVLTPMWVDVHFYFTHRLIHWRPLYRWVHSLHHKNINVGPWSGVAMHPVEHVVFFSAATLFWLIPSHPLHSVFILATLALGPTMSHQGFDRVVLGKKLSLPADHYMHYLHHKYVRVNFGSDLVPLDRWLGTFHDGSERQMAKRSSQIEPP